MINLTALRITLAPLQESICILCMVTHPEQRSKNLGQKVIPSDEQSKRCVKIGTLRSPT